MASRGLGSLTLDLIAKIGGFVGPLTQAERELDRRTKRMNKMAYDFGRSIGASIRSAAGSFLAFAGVSVSIGTAVTALKSAIDTADQLRDASIRLGVGTEALSKWGYAARQSGTDIETLAKGLRILSRNATEALNPNSSQAGLFRALGVGPDDLRDLNTLLPKVADSFKQLEDGPQKAALAMELFGKSGADLIEFLNQGSSGLDEYGNKLEQLGGVVTRETAAAADEFNDKLADLKQQFAGAGLALAERLLPHLNEFVDWAGRASDKSSGLGKVISWLGDQADAAARDFDFFKASLKDVVSYWNALNSAMAARGFISTGNIKAAIEEMKKGQAALQSVQFNNVTGGVTSRQRVGRFASAAYEQASLNFNPNHSKGNAALDAYFETGGRSSRSSGGKSKAESEAEKLTAAYERMKQSLAEQVALFGKVGETVRERYELENGELAKLDPLRKAEVVTLLDKIDALNAEKAAQEEIDKITKDREQAQIRDIENAARLIDDMQFELTLLGLTNDEREREIALRQAGANATDAQIQKISELTSAIQQGRKESEFWENAQRGLSDALYDTVTGATSALDAAKNFFDSIAQYITRMIADQWAEKIMGLFNSSGSGGGDTGGFFSSILSSLFGGGRASGGWTSPNKLYEVNERGFEMATVGGRDYMLTGNSPVHITPNHRLGGGMAVTQNFYNPVMANRQTEAQRQREAARNLRRQAERA